MNTVQIADRMASTRLDLPALIASSAGVIVEASNAADAAERGDSERTARVDDLLSDAMTLLASLRARLALADRADEVLS